jgi:predicted Na+-dependent transporter
MIKKINTVVSGVLTGLVIPILFYMVFYFAKFKNLNFISYYKQVYLGTLLPLLISRCILPNLLLFFIFSWVNWEKAAKGVFIATLGLTIILFALKLIFY